MKRILCFALTAVMLLVCLTACGKSVESYQKVLEEADYEVAVADEDEIKDFLDDFDLDEKDFEINAMLIATKGIKAVTIIEFKSSGDAEKFAEKADSADDVMSFFGGSIESDGKCVFIGAKAAINDALGK